MERKIIYRLFRYSNGFEPLLVVKETAKIYTALERGWGANKWGAATYRINKDNPEVFASIEEARAGLEKRARKRLLDAQQALDAARSNLEACRNYRFDPSTIPPLPEEK